ncbi:MAG: 4'-phosphopantetheinyl transferase superfamily protein [bacterium]
MRHNTKREPGPGAGEISANFGPDNIHVWLAALDSSEADLAAFMGILSDDEKERADRYITGEARRRFITGRGILRRLLALYIPADPEEIVFAYNEYGRPVIAGPPDSNTVAFNLSHSAGGALYAISRGATVGVDLERVRTLDFLSISSRFFATSEAAALAALPGSEQMGAFFQCWTRKEACAKAQGTGLYLNLRDIEVSLGPGVPPTVVRLSGSTDAAAGWSLHDIDAGGEFKAALAVKAAKTHITRFMYPEDARPGPRSAASP